MLATSSLLRIVNPHFLSSMASNDVASNICARHVITRIVNPCFLSSVASYDVASTIHQSPPR